MKDFGRRFPETAMLVVETGNVLKQSDNLEDPANRWVLEALNALGSHAVHTTFADLRRMERLAELGKLSETAGTEYVATVLDPGASSKFPLKRYAIRSLRPEAGDAEVRVGILAVSSPSSDAGGSAVSLSADVALKKYLPEVDRQSDLVVVLARLSDPELTRIAETFPAVDVLINGSATGEGREFPKIGGTVIVESAHGGVAMGVLELEWDEKGRVTKSNNQLVPLPPMIPDDVRLAQIAEKAHRERTLYMEEEALKSPPVTTPSIYAGAPACKDCHEKAFKVWVKSAHAHAADTLEKTRDHFNPECLRCHVTGFEERRGFVNILRTPDLADVQCEACHTPSLQHSQHPQEHRPGSEIGVRHRRKVRKELCLSCHTEENSPRFDFELYWKKIEH